MGICIRNCQQQARARRPSQQDTTPYEMRYNTAPGLRNSRTTPHAPDTAKPEKLLLFRHFFCVRRACGTAPACHAGARPGPIHGALLQGLQPVLFTPAPLRRGDCCARQAYRRTSCAQLCLQSSRNAFPLRKNGLTAPSAQPLLRHRAKPSAAKALPWFSLCRQHATPTLPKAMNACAAGAPARFAPPMKKATCRRLFSPQTDWITLWIFCVNQVNEASKCLHSQGTS